jgi:hypothetical protein
MHDKNVEAQVAYLLLSTHYLGKLENSCNLSATPSGTWLQGVKIKASIPSQNSVVLKIQKQMRLSK